MIGRVKKLSFGIFLLLAQAIIFLNAGIFGEEFEAQYTSAMAGYLIFYAIFFANLVRNPTFKMTLTYSFPRFFIFLIIGLIIGNMTSLFALFQVELERDPQFMKGLLLYQIFFVANVEESIFRGALPQFLPKPYSPFIASVIFGIFHIGAYYLLSQKTGQSLPVLIGVAIFAGLMFQGISDKFGLPASIGLHAGINIASMEVL